MKKYTDFEDRSTPPFENFPQGHQTPLSYRPKHNYPNSIIEHSPTRIPSPSSDSFRSPCQPIYENSFYNSESTSLTTKSTELVMHPRHRASSSAQILNTASPLQMAIGKMKTSGAEAEAQVHNDDSLARPCKDEPPVKLEKVVREIQTNLANIGCGIDHPPKTPLFPSQLLTQDRQSTKGHSNGVNISPKTPSKIVKSINGPRSSTTTKGKRSYSEMKRDTMIPAQKLDGMVAAFRELDRKLDSRLADLTAIHEGFKISFDFAKPMRRHLDIKETGRSRTKSEIVKRNKKGNFVYLDRHDEESGGVSLGKEVRTHYEEMNEMRERDDDEGGRVEVGETKRVDLSPNAKAFEPKNGKGTTILKVVHETAKA